jgi:ubiquitin carboxyl-terminal hydrolase 8
MSIKKELDYRSLSELEKAFEFDFKTLDFNKPAVCNTLLKIFDHGQSLLKLGDEENAYGFLMRFVDGSIRLRKSDAYKQDKTYIDTMISTRKLSKTIEALEDLKRSLRSRYDAKSKADAAAELTVIEKKVAPVTEKKPNTTPVRKDLTPKDLVEILTKTSDKILIIDTRSQSEFANSQMNLSILLSSEKKRQEQISYINIPSEFISSVSWHIMEAIRGENTGVAQIFANRKNYDYLVLLDSDSDFKKLSQDSKLLTLKRAMFEYDLDEKLKNEPLILDGGFNQWLTFYPGFTTNAATKINIQTENKNLIKNTFNFEYPELDAKPKPASVTAQPTQPVQPIAKETFKEETAINSDQSVIDSEKMLLLGEEKSNKNDSENKSIPKIPSVNRSNKPSLNLNSNKAIINIESEDVKPSIKPQNLPQKDINLSDSEEEVTTEPARKLSNERVNVKSENSPDISKLNIGKEPQSVNNANINVAKPPSYRPPDFANNPAINPDILSGVYMPSNRLNRPIQTPYMKEGTSKVLDNRTGLYNTHVPPAAPSTLVSNQSIPPTAAPQGPKFTPPTFSQPKFEPPSKKVENKQKPSSSKEAKFGGSNLKRTLSSPNIAKLDDELDLDESVNEAKPFFKKPELKSPQLPPKNAREDVPRPAAMKPAPVPNVNRNSKPLSAHMIRSRIEDLQPVYGNAHQGLVGVRNLGNTCFMNSILQCLASTKKLVAYFLNDQYNNDLNRVNDLGFRGEIADEFAVIVQAIWGGYCRIIAPRRFKALIGQFNEQFISNDQQDAQEFLLFLLDGLHEDLNRVSSVIK